MDRVRLVLVVALLLVVGHTVVDTVWADDGNGLYTPRGDVWSPDVYDEYVGHLDAPKGVIGYDGIQCVGETYQGGHHWKLTTYVGADAGEMADNPERERAWQRGQCESDVLLMAGFWYSARGMQLDPSQVKITTKPV